MLNYLNNNYYINLGDILARVLLGETLSLCNFCINNSKYKDLICFNILTFNIYFIKFLQKSGSRILNISSDHLCSISNHIFDLSDFPQKLYFLASSFSFLFSNLFRRIMITCAYNPFFCRHFFQDCFNISWKTLRLIFFK